ncbi:MAG: RDD family protein [Pseudomonadales bacterium]
MRGRKPKAAAQFEAAGSSATTAVANTLAQVPAERLPAAGALRRAGAMTYDGMLVVALWLATLFPMVALSNRAVHGAAVQSLVFLEMYAFFVLFWLYRGQTLGMLAWRLAIETDDGRPLTLLRLTLRFFVTLLPVLAALLAWRAGGMPAVIVCLSAGVLAHSLAWFDPQGRSFADRVSGTRIVQLPRRTSTSLE